MDRNDATRKRETDPIVLAVATAIRAVTPLGGGIVDAITSTADLPVEHNAFKAARAAIAALASVNQK